MRPLSSLRTSRLVATLAALLVACAEATVAPPAADVANPPDATLGLDASEPPRDVRLPPGDSGPERDTDPRPDADAVSPVLDADAEPTDTPPPSDASDAPDARDVDGPPDAAADADTPSDADDARDPDTADTADTDDADALADAADTATDTLTDADLDAEPDTEPPAPAELGAVCTEDADCASERCTRVRAHLTDARCVSACASLADCDAGFSCTPVTHVDEAGERVCVPDGWCTDRDGDGFGAGLGCLGPDCDDDDPSAFFGAEEVCDGVDNDCDGSVDEDFEGAGLASCDGDPATGCEAAIRTDPANCGGCGIVCAPGDPCLGGRCGCPGDQILCDGVCRDANDCGGCGALAHAPGDPCGTCRAWACADGGLVCVGPEPNACGGCATLPAAPGGGCGYCNTGVLVCDGADATRCAGASSPLTDPSHCGACGVVCRDGRTCESGACVCPPGQVRVTGSPASVSTCAGGDVSFSADVAGAIVGLRWERSVDGGTVWGPVQDDAAHIGATAATLVIRGVGLPLDQTRYRLRVDGSCSSEVSAAATLSLRGAPTAVSAAAVPTTLCAGDALNLLGSATDATGWDWSGPGGWSAAGQFTTRDDVQPGASGLYQLRASNACGTRSAVSAPVDVRPRTAIVAQPSTAVACPGGSVSFSVEAVGAELSVRWERSTNGGGSWSPVADGATFQGATTDRLVVVGVTADMDGHRFRARVEGACGTLFSAAPQLNLVSCDAGACGPADGGSTVAPPAVGLCAAGQPSAVTGSGPWAWTCVGELGGASAACASNRSCAGVPRGWTVGGASCTGSVSTAPHGGSASAEDGGLPTIGAATFTCAQGVWQQGLDAACTDLEADCPPFIDNDGLRLQSAEYLQGSDGAWYCLERNDRSEFGTCEDRLRSVRSLTGPARACTSTERSGGCCASWPGGICDSRCDGALCQPFEDACTFTCNGTSYLGGCRVP